MKKSVISKKILLILALKLNLKKFTLKIIVGQFENGPRVTLSKFIDLY